MCIRCTCRLLITWKSKLFCYKVLPKWPVLKRENETLRICFLTFKVLGVLRVLFRGQQELSVFDGLSWSIGKRRVEQILSFKSQNGFNAVDPRLGSRTANQARGWGEALFHVLGLGSNKLHRTFWCGSKQTNKQSMESSARFPIQYT